jgi:hypothetical protein
MKLSKRNARSLSAAFLGLTVLAGATAAAPAANAGVYVGIYAPIAPPAPRIEVRPVRPAPAAIWIDGHWRWANGGHLWVPGHWEVPPRRYHAWAPGHWRHGPRGWIWVEGHWR